MFAALTNSISQCLYTMKGVSDGDASKSNTMIWYVKTVLWITYFWNQWFKRSNCLLPTLGNGWRWGHCTSERALGMHLLSLQIPIKIDCQEQLMALLGMLRPGLPSVKHFYVISKDYDFFSNLLKYFFYGRTLSAPGLTSGLLFSSYNVKTWLNILKYLQVSFFLQFL